MRPIDLQITIPKMTEIASLQGSENTRRLISSQNSADSTRAMVDADTREVHSKKDVQPVMIRTVREREAGERDGEGKRGGGRGKSNGGAAGGDPNGARADDAKTAGGIRKKNGSKPDNAVNSHIDIRL